ncbi:uncharacterized protein ACIBXB_001999 [Morphnus guianensis]
MSDGSVLLGLGILFLAAGAILLAIGHHQQVRGCSGPGGPLGASAGGGWPQLGDCATLLCPQGDGRRRRCRRRRRTASHVSPLRVPPRVRRCPPRPGQGLSEQTSPGAEQPGGTAHGWSQCPWTPTAQATPPWFAGAPGGPLCGPWRCSPGCTRCITAAQELRQLVLSAWAGTGASATLHAGTWRAAWQDLEELVERGHLPCCGIPGRSHCITAAQELRQLVLSAWAGTGASATLDAGTWRAAWQDPEELVERAHLPCCGIPGRSHCITAAQELRQLVLSAWAGTGASATLDAGTWRAAWQDPEELVERGHLPCRGCSSPRSPESLSPSDSLRKMGLTGEGEGEGESPVERRSARSPGRCVSSEPPVPLRCTWQGQDWNAAGDPARASAAVPAARGAAAAGLPCPAVALPGRAEPALATAQAAPLAAGECKRHRRQPPRGGSLEAGGGPQCHRGVPGPAGAMPPTAARSPGPAAPPGAQRVGAPGPGTDQGNGAPREGQQELHNRHGSAEDPAIHPSASAGERGEPEPPAPGRGPVALGREAPVAFCFSHGPPCPSQPGQGGSRARSQAGGTIGCHPAINHQQPVRGRSEQGGPLGASASEGWPRAGDCATLLCPEGKQEKAWRSSCRGSPWRCSSPCPSWGGLGPGPWGHAVPLPPC